MCVFAVNTSKVRRCSSQEVNSQPSSSVVGVPDKASCSDTVDGIGRHGHGFSVSFEPVFPCPSAASGDASASGAAAADEKPVTGK